MEMRRCKGRGFESSQGEAGLRTVLEGMPLEGSFNIHALGNVASS